MQSYWMMMTDTGAALELRDVPVPAAGAQQLLVRMRAAALNRGEFLLGHGLHGEPARWKAIGMRRRGRGRRGRRRSHRLRPAIASWAAARRFAEYALMEAARR
jgi:hypothetical protein